MKSAVTICLVPEARQGPFVFHGTGMAGIEAGCRRAAELGFDGVELFPGSADDLPRADVRRLLDGHGLALAAVGTGAGWVKHALHLCHADADVRRRAREFIAGLVDAAGELGAPVILGSMQGRTAAGVSRDDALRHLAEALDELSMRAATHGQMVLYEPLNRYETDLFNRQGEGAAFLAARGLRHVKLLCDLFHMNIEEADIAATLAACSGHVGHVHWADSNRHAVGGGHTDMPPVVAALRAAGFAGYLSAEVFPLPTSDEAARQSITSFRLLSTG